MKWVRFAIVVWSVSGCVRPPTQACLGIVVVNCRMVMTAAPYQQQVMRELLWIGVVW